VIIAQLNSAHLRTGFHCEEETLTRYLQQQAGQDMRRRLSVCYVAADDSNRVIGYYTLSSMSLSRDSIPEAFVKQVPVHYAVPLVLLGRLARDISVKGQGIGEILLLDALKRACRISTAHMGALAVVVDPIHDKAAAFYQQFGFIRLPESNMMFLPMKQIEALAL